MIQNITDTDTERKLKTQINLLTTTNEVLAERLAAAETEHATELAAYALTVENLTAERDALAERVKAMEAQLDKRRDQIGDLNVAHAKEQRQNFERVKALEADAGRYRWLLANGLFAQSQGYDTQIGIAGVLFVNGINTPAPSAAIDAAMKGTP